jgi:hypothetical protein
MRYALTFPRAAEFQTLIEKSPEGGPRTRTALLAHAKHVKLANFIAKAASKHGAPVRSFVDLGDALLWLHTGG